MHRTTIALCALALAPSACGSLAEHESPQPRLASASSNAGPADVGKMPVVSKTALEHGPAPDAKPQPEAKPAPDSDPAAPEAKPPSEAEPPSEAKPAPDSDPAAPEAKPPSEARPPSEAKPAPDSDPEMGRDDEFGLVRAERIGNLHLGMTAAEVVTTLGRPKKGKKIEEPASGDIVQVWTYPAKGISIDMLEGEGGQKIGRFSVAAPSTLTTSRGIGVGASLAEVERAYGSDRDAEMSSDEVFIAGSVYGGVFFHIENGRVASIFVGAGAE